MSTITETRPDTRQLSTEPGDHDRFAHYADKAKIAEAYVMGTPITAACGKVWVPSADPSKFPICPRCKEIVEDLS